MRPKAVALVSGGLDSASALAIARHEGFATYALSFRYGQRHSHEVEAARAVVRSLGVERHVVAKIDSRIFSGSALTDGIEVPRGRRSEEIGSGIPVTYVPARNTIFLAHALGWAEVLGADDIYIGVTAVDYSGYPDCRPEFIRAFEEMANLATRATTEGGRRIRIRTPLIALTKSEIIRRGLALGVDYGLTRTCYAPDEKGRGCGACDACVLRLKGFREAGVEDPAPYVVRSLGNGP